MQEIKPIHVSFEQAKLLKEKGFNIPVRGLYDNLNPEMPPATTSLADWNDFNGLSAPEQWQVIEWLRINYDIDFNISRLPSEAVKISKEKGRNTLKNYAIWVSKQDLNPKGINQTFYGDIPQEAYEAAIEYTLKNLLP